MKYPETLPWKIKDEYWYFDKDDNYLGDSSTPEETIYLVTAANMLPEFIRVVQDILLANDGIFEGGPNGITTREQIYARAEELLNRIKT